MVKQLFSGLLTIALVGLPLRAEEPRPAPKPILGVMVATTAKDAPKAGAVIREVAPDGPAAKAGLKAGDLIVKVDNKDIADAKMLVEAVAGHKPGATMTLHVLRDGKEMKLEAKLGEQPVARRLPLPDIFSDRHAAFLGVHANAMTPDLKKKLDAAVEHGAVVAEVMPDSPAAKAGLKADDIITHVGDQAVANPDELRAAVRKVGAGKEVVVKFLRGKDKKEAKVQLGEMPRPLSMLPHFDGRFPLLDKKLPQGFDKDMERHFEKLHQWLRDLEPQSDQQD